MKFEFEIEFYSENGLHFRIILTIFQLKLVVKSVIETESKKCPQTFENFQ